MTVLGLSASLGCLRFHYQRRQTACAPVSVSSYCLCLQNQRGKLNLPRCDTGQIVRVLEVIFCTDAES